jgi:hypothetical protein
MKVALKYCGSCNPQVELGPIARRLRELVASAVTFVPLAGGEADLVIILNGCLTACADRPDVREMARDSVILAGESIETQAVPEGQLAERLAEIILSKV